MHVVYLHQYFNTPDMNGSTRSFEIARRLVGFGHTVDVVTTDRGREGFCGWKTTDVEGVRVHWVWVPYSNQLSYARRLVQFAAFAARCASRARSLHGDLVYASSTPLTIAMPAIYASRRNGVPFVFEVRDLWPEIPIRLGALRSPPLVALARWLEKATYREAKHIVALSPDMTSNIRSRFPELRVTTVPNFADPWAYRSDSQATSRAPESGRIPTILYAGTIGLVNNLTYLVEIADAARRMGLGLRFLVVGEGREETRVRDAAQRRGLLGETFFMRPPVSKRDLPTVFADATVSVSFVLDDPCLWANSANKFFDGLAAGKPVAINHRGWLADVIEKHEVGVVLPPSDPPAAASALARVALDPATVAGMGRRAHALAVAQFSADGAAVAVNKVLCSAASCPHRVMR